jgi:hypothetical protein
VIDDDRTADREPSWAEVGEVDGLLARLSSDADPSWSDRVISKDVVGTLVWSASHGHGEQHGLLTLERPGVRAVCLAPRGADPRRVRAALQLSRRLGAQRAGGAGWAPAYLTSPTPPATPRDLVRVPHLVTICRDTGELADHHAHAPADAVVWELMPTGAAQRWLGAPLPDQGLVETHLDALLALRTAARTRRLPATTAGARLAALLHGRPEPLSIALVYRHLDLFRDLCAETAEAPA